MKSILRLPACLYYGPKTLECVTESITRFGIKQILIFTDVSLRKLGKIETLESHIAKNVDRVEIVDQIKPEPSVHEVEETLAEVRNPKPDLLIGIGGGSVMDTTKLASVLLDTPYSVRDLLKDPLKVEKKCRTLMIPTTCGTGSEATGNAIVSIPEEQVKKGIVNPLLIPDEVILDVELVSGLPKPLIASTGVDALAHCVECYTSKKATPLSDLYASEGAKLIFHNIETAYTKEDTESMEKMLLGAYYGGAAIAGSGTTAVHALSYPLGGRYHIPHGVSNAILFANVMRFNRDACKGRLASLCDSVYPESIKETEDKKADLLIHRITEIVKNTEIPVSLKSFGLNEENLEELALAGSQQTRLLQNNMKELSLDDIRAIYRQVI